MKRCIYRVIDNDTVHVFAPNGSVFLVFIALRDPRCWAAIVRNPGNTTPAIDFLKQAWPALIGRSDIPLEPELPS